MQQVKSGADERMVKSIASLKAELTKIRTGRANPALLENVQVSAYGTDTPLNQVASITVEARNLLVSPWDKSTIPHIEKAIISAGLGLNPVTTGNVIRVPMPPLNEERRKELIKVVRDEVENARISIRNIRRDANQSLKDLVKNKEINEDDQRRLEADIQKLTDKFIAEADGLLTAKEAELMEI
ncbi:MAG: frr [Gammaproteobacteria bacterium]|jgi:ribosome recycling factor|nr:frr [Gammaproteobacteria bacterium]